MAFQFQLGDRVRFRGLSNSDWQVGDVIDRREDFVHIYGEDMTTYTYLVRSNGQDFKVCVMWDDIQFECPLDRLARI